MHHSLRSGARHAPVSSGHIGTSKPICSGARHAPERSDWCMVEMAGVAPASSSRMPVGLHAESAWVVSTPRSKRTKCTVSNPEKCRETAGRPSDQARRSNTLVPTGRRDRRGWQLRFRQLQERSSVRRRDCSLRREASPKWFWHLSCPWVGNGDRGAPTCANGVLNELSIMVIPTVALNPNPAKPDEWFRVNESAQRVRSDAGLLAS